MQVCMAMPATPPPEDHRAWGMPAISAILVLLLIAGCAVCCGLWKQVFG
jgi:hypothetical protein